MTPDNERRAIFGLLTSLLAPIQGEARSQESQQIRGLRITFDNVPHARSNCAVKLISEFCFLFMTPFPLPDVSVDNQSSTCKGSRVSSQAKVRWLKLNRCLLCEMASPETGVVCQGFNLAVRLPIKLSAFRNG
jgi:hypothetical protein